MGVVIKMTPSSFQAIEEGEYLVDLFQVDAREGKFGPALDFRFKIGEGEYAGTEVTGLVSATLQPGNKLDKWLRALGVNTLEIGQELDTDTLIGAKCYAYIVPTAGKKEGQVFNNIQTIRPYKRPVTSGNVGGSGGVTSPVTKPVTKASPAVAPKAPATKPVVQEADGIEW